MDAAIFIPMMVMLPPVLIVVGILYYRYRRTRARYQLLLQLADKGVELPAQLLAEPQIAYSERRRALVLMGSGLGLILMFAALPFQLDNGQSVHGFWAIGLLPLMTGAGYLASWWLNARENLRA